MTFVETKMNIGFLISNLSSFSVFGICFYIENSFIHLNWSSVCGVIVGLKINWKGAVQKCTHAKITRTKSPVN